MLASRSRQGSTLRLHQNGAAVTNKASVSFIHLVIQLWTFLNLSKERKISKRPDWTSAQLRILMQANIATTNCNGTLAVFSLLEHRATALKYFYKFDNMGKQLKHFNGRFVAVSLLSLNSFY